MQLSKDKTKIYIYALLTILTFVVIYLFSSQAGQQSHDLSDLIYQKLAGTWFGSLVEYLENVCGFSIRKDAHIMLYFCLGICSSLFFHKIIRRPAAQLGGTVLFCTMAAAFDEWHQTFIPERTGRWQDVLIDAVGFGGAILLVYFVVWMRGKRR